MNRCRISHSFLLDLKQGLQNKPRNRKIRIFIEKWKLELKNGHVFHQGKEIVPYTEDEPEYVEAVLKHEAEHNGMPLSRDGALAYVNKKYVGFKKRAIASWLKRIEQLQLIHRRPNAKTRINTQSREGIRNYRMATKFDGKFCLGVDLFQIPKEWSGYKFFFVAVLQKTGYLWLEPMTNKFAKTAKTQLVKVFRDCKKRFGSEPTAVVTDDGNEFKGAFDKYIASRGIKRHIVPHVSWVEKKNSTFGRTFAVMRNLYGYKKALELTLLKVNNTQNRITRKAPADWIPEDFNKKMKRHNRKMKIFPRRQRPKRFSVEDRVRHMLRATLGKTSFYKSYEGMRSKKHAMWSKKLYKISDKRKINGRIKYKVNGTWWFPTELLLCEEDIIRLRGPPRQKPKPKKVSKPKGQKVAHKAPARKVVARVAPQPVLRRSSRLRNKAPVSYVGM
jgi:hypothetical protein